MKLSISNHLWAVIVGVLAMMALTLGFAAVFAALIGAGLVPAALMRFLVWGITVVAGLIGGLLCAAKAGKARLPMSLAAAAVYLLLVFILRGLIYQSVGEQFWVILICALLGSATGALLASKQKKRKY